MHDIILKLKNRTVSGKKVSGLRKIGQVPSVVYGSEIEPINTQSDDIATRKVVKMAGRHTPVKLDIDGKKQLAIIKSIDFEPVKHSILHLAFQAIKQNEAIVTEVPIVLIGEGESLAEKAGLVILQAIESIEIKAKPNDLPSSLEVSIKDLETDEDKLFISDIKLPAGVEFADVEQDMELVIANVYEPSALAAANEAAGGDAEEETIPEEAEEGESSEDSEDSRTEGESSDKDKSEDSKE